MLRSWHPRNFAIELKLCKRWFQKSYPVDQVPVAGTSAGFHAMSANGGVIFSPEIRFPVEMRATPTTITWFNPVTAGSNQARDTTTNGDCTNTATNASSSTTIIPQATLPAGAAVGNQIIVCWSVDAGL